MSLKSLDDKLANEFEKQGVEPPSYVDILLFGLALWSPFLIGYLVVQIIALLDFHPIAFFFLCLIGGLEYADECDC